jgi:hypothetical protein
MGCLHCFVEQNMFLLLTRDLCVDVMIKSSSINPTDEGFDTFDEN